MKAYSNFNSLTKSVFEIKTYLAFSIDSFPYRMDVLLSATESKKE